MSNPKRTVLITGCSEGGMGAALALAFREAGLRVIATARNPSKMESLKRAGVETFQLDIQSEESIHNCVSQLSSLDILVNNAGGGLRSSFVDTDLTQAKELFDLNVWAQMAMTQACMPLLLKSDRAVIVNHSSSASIIPVPFGSVYNASKAALSMFSDTIRLELEAFNIKVVDLKTGLVRTNFSNNVNVNKKPALPEESIYAPASQQMERLLRSEMFDGQGTDPYIWAKSVVNDVLKRNPPAQIYCGESAWYARIMPVLPFGMLNGTLKKATGLEEVEQMLKKQKRV